MTDVTRPVRRRTIASHFSRGRRKQIIVELRPPGTLIYFRLAGERRTVSLSVADCYTLGCQAEAQAKKRAKKEARDAKRKKTI